MLDASHTVCFGLRIHSKWAGPRASTGDQRSLPPKSQLLDLPITA